MNSSAYTFDKPSSSFYNNSIDQSKKVPLREGIQDAYSNSQNFRQQYDTNLFHRNCVGYFPQQFNVPRDDSFRYKAPLYMANYYDSFQQTSQPYQNTVQYQPVISLNDQQQLFQGYDRSVYAQKPVYSNNIQSNDGQSLYYPPNYVHLSQNYQVEAENYDPVKPKTPDKEEKDESSTVKRNRMTYSRVQLEALEREFLKNNFIHRQKRSDLSETLGLTEKQIKIWFQNRRMKKKKEKTKPVQVCQNPSQIPHISLPEKDKENVA